MKMICMKCRRIYEGQDYCDVCSCPPEGIWQFLRPVAEARGTADHLKRDKE